MWKTLHRIDNQLKTFLFTWKGLAWSIIGSSGIVGFLELLKHR